MWTALSSPDPGRSYHSLLAESFSHGRADLLVDPSPELLSLADPYDPAQNAPYALHDATLYNGRYYLYFGPVPAAVLFLPLRVIGVDLNDRWAAPLLAWGGFALSAVLMLVLIRRYAPRTPTVWRLVAIAALGMMNAVPFLLRRPAVYETSIAAGLLFGSAAVLLLVAGSLRQRPSVRMIALGSLAMGLAVGSRTNMILLLPLLVWAWLRGLGRRAQWNTWRRVRWTAAATAPLAACLLVLAVYNFTRFGSFTEFGTNYQLTGVNTRTFDFFSLDRLVPGAWFYLLQPPHFGLDFPFITLRPEYPGTLPSPFFVEPVAGILAVTPLLLALLAVPWLTRRGRPLDREARIVGVLLVAIAIALPLVPLLAFGGATERYEVDFATFLVVLGLVAWLGLADALRARTWARRSVLGVGLAAIAFGSVAGLAFSVVGYYDGLRVAHPRTYERLETFFSFIPTTAARVQGKPILLEVSPPAGTATPESRLQLATPGDGVAVIRATVVASASLPPGSTVAADVAGTRGLPRRIHAVVGQAVSLHADLDGAGLADVTVRWREARPAQALGKIDPASAGLGLADAQIERWTPE